MDALMEAIRTAVAATATAEQKAIGAQACRTILAALGAEPGKPIALPGAPQPHPLSGASIDQALDLAIARLTAVANARDKAEQASAPPAPTRGPQIAMVRTPPTALPRQRPTRRSR